MSYGFNNDKSRFPLGAASDLPDPTKTPLKIIGELQNQIIDSASIENGATASKAYASGDYVCFQGALCKASKAISQGDTLSIGDSANDNLTLTDAAAEFARINSDLSDKDIYEHYFVNYPAYNAGFSHYQVFPDVKPGYQLVGATPNHLQGGSTTIYLAQVSEGSMYITAYAEYNTTSSQTLEYILHYAKS